MQTRQLVEVAALLASHGPALIEGKATISHSALEQYWATSKCRCERWLRAIKRLASSTANDAENRAASMAEIQPLLEEIFLTEMVLRVWTAVLYAYDRRRRTNDAEPVAQNVLVSHLEIRTRALVLLVHSPLLDSEAAVLLNRLRRRMERWTDLLLGHLEGDYKVSELGFDSARVLEFSADLRQQPRSDARQQAWGLTLSALRLAFENGLAEETPDGLIDHDIAASILACFPAESFESTGMLRSLWMVRMAHTTADAQGMIDSLLQNVPRRRTLPKQPLRFDGPASRRF